MSARPYRRSRKLHWISSVNGDTAALAELDRVMADFYSQPKTRQRYQRMIDADASAQPVTESALRRAVLAKQPGRVLEIGCGSGRIYERLRDEGFTGAYTGLEMSAETIAQNARRFPDARWARGSVYEGVKGEVFDAVFSYFVLEHCVYPARALESIGRMVAPGGSAFLVFPDFPEMGRFGSQALGFVEGNARHRLVRGDLLNALFNLYESRIRLPAALRAARARYGPFPVNLNPRCLDWDGEFEPDLDAVYIASRQEVQEWGTSRGFEIAYPAGTDDNFRHNVLIELRRPM